MTKQDFVQLLENHDWFFERTEDSRVYKRGAEQRRLIMDTKSQFGEDGEYLYQKYAKRYEERITGASSSKPIEMKSVMCLSSGRLGHLVDKSANGYLEIIFNDAVKTEFLSQSNVFIID